MQSEQELFPVEVSAPALVQVKRLIERKGTENSFLRLGVKGGGCSGLEYVLKLDENLRESDFILEVDGFKIACDPKSAEFLRGATLVYTGNLIGGGFSFENPNAKRSCGCGTSFTPVEKAV